MKRAAAVILTGLVLLCTAGAADPYIGYLYPAGAETGRSIRLLAGGQNLSGVHSGIVSGGGVTVRKVTVVPGFPPPDREQRKYLLQWIKNIETGKPERPPLPEKTDSWRKNPWWEKLDQLDPLSFLLVVRDLHTKRNALQATPSLRQIVIVDLTVDADARPGVRELRLWGKQGISAPKLFFVDAAPHVPEPEFTAPGKPRPEPPLVSNLPAILDGQVMPGETDRFRLRLAAGKEYTMTLTGRRFQPFIGDAVPGHFQPILRLLDSEGNEAAFADDNYFDPDPVLRFRPSRSGVYTLEIRDNLFRGREDFVYRVLVEPTKRPFRFGVEPFPGLPRLSTETGTVAVDRPAVLAGTLQSSEVKRLNFTGKAGMRVVFDVAARRCGSPLDAVLRLTGPDGKTVAEVDDSPSELNIGTCLQQVDPLLSIELPVDGEYRLELFNRTSEGGDDYRYRLRIGPPQPDFEVYTTRSILNLAAGAAGKVKLCVVRRDGFDGEIRIGLKNGKLTGKSVVPAGQSEFTIQVKNPGGRPRGPVELHFTAEATIDGKKIRKEVIPCDEFIQAFAYTHLLPVETFYLGTLRAQRSARK